MPWLCALCAVLAVIAVVLAVKTALLQKAVREIRTELSSWIEKDTNTLISVSSGDRHIRRLAAELNSQLRLLRNERRRLQSGDLELKEAVANISHDLRTPLTAICGYLDLLKREEKSEEVARYLTVIENRAEALKQLTEELFRYSVIASTAGELAFDDVVISSVLEESVSAHYAALKGAGIRPEISIPAAKIRRRLDRGALSRIFGNIIGNAIKYSDGDLQIFLSEKGEIVFTNSSSRLNEVQVGKLFDRFYTVESGKKSTGLGLSIAKILTEHMNGKINATYKNGKLSIHIAFPEP